MKTRLAAAALAAVLSSVVWVPLAVVGLGCPWWVGLPVIVLTIAAVPVLADRLAP